MGRRAKQNIYNDFTDSAKISLDKSVNNYKNELIKKSYDIKCEESEPGDNAITQTHVSRAEKVLRLKKRKNNVKMIALNYVVDVLTFFIGVFFDLEKLQSDKNFLIGYMIIALIWSWLIVTKHSKEGE